MNYSEAYMRSGINTRSMGLKLIVVCALAVFITIPSVFVFELVSERTHRAAEVLKEISSHVGGPQTFLGPTLAVPYTVPSNSPTAAAENGVYLIFPIQAVANITTTTTERHRSLFRVPVFQADLKLDSTFDLSKAPAAAPAKSRLRLGPCGNHRGSERRSRCAGRRNFGGRFGTEHIDSLRVGRPGLVGRSR